MNKSFTQIKVLTFAHLILYKMMLDEYCVKEIRGLQYIKPSITVYIFFKYFLTIVMVYTTLRLSVQFSGH